MSTVTLTAPRLATRPAAAGRVTQRNLVRSEWTKFWTVRSTGWSLLVAFVLMVSGVAISAITVNDGTISATFNSIDGSVSGYHFAELAVAVLGVIAITSEYATGMIRSSFMAAPARLGVLWAKLLVLAAVAFVTMLAASFIAFFGTQAVVSSHGLAHSIGDPGALRTVIGAAIAMTGVGALGIAIGALTRRTAAGISTIVALLWVLPGLLTLLPASIANAIKPYLPSAAMQTVTTFSHQAHTLGTWTGLGVFAAYVAALLAVAAVRLRRGDA